MPLDPAVVTRYADKLQQTTLLVTISASPIRYFTNFPGGITTGGQTYIYRSFKISNVIESTDGSAIQMTLTFDNVDSLLNDLVTDPAQRRKPVVVAKLHFNPDWSVAAPESWLEGFTAKPRIYGLQVEIICRDDSGREGASPDITYGDVLVRHAAPAANNQFLFAGGLQ
ncbi:MAG TPA: hypothetical protein VLC46_20195 [Thermoanaerobaculia bacterium]|jgi:hypothetical protein|nr:hypothetical protein [Thermoanaerobaculia bacterium]